MSSLTVSPSNGYISPTLANVKFSRVALKPGGQKFAQVCFLLFKIIRKFDFVLVSLF